MRTYLVRQFFGRGRIFGIVFLLAYRCVFVSGVADDASRFLEKRTFEDGKVVVVSEGDLEPRSIGSFAVRLYSGKNPEFPFDDFLSGLIRARDGVIESIKLTDLDGDEQQELVVIVRSVGTGGYLSAQAFQVQNKRLKFVKAVEGLAKDADPLIHLKK